jgi:Cu(I)/Ag(I) efflux system membrane fusion protein
MKIKTLSVAGILFVSAIFGCTGKKSQTKGSEKTIYSCTMHHQVREDHAGVCPICGMDMVIVPDINNW